MEKIKIGAHDIKLVFMNQKKMRELYIKKTGQDPADSGETLRGLFVAPDRIVVDSNLTGIYKVGVIFHEVEEAINDFYEMGMEHDKITLHGEVSLQIFKDNWKYMQELFNNVK